MSLRALERKIRHLRDRLAIWPSAEEYTKIRRHFDADFYAKNHDLSKISKRKLINHYRKIGWRLGYDPAPFFSTIDYLQQNPDVKSSGQNPFYHYLKKGRAEGRRVRHSQRRFFGVIAHIDAAIWCPIAKKCLIVGWSLQRPGLVIHARVGEQSVDLQKAFRFDRPDVRDVYGDEGVDAGFLLLIDNVNTCHAVSLQEEEDHGSTTLCEAHSSTLSSRVAEASKTLFAIPTPIEAFGARTAAIDEHLLRPLMQKRDQELQYRSAVSVFLGAQTRTTTVDIVIPLYGTLSFVENQLLHFSNDPWLRDHAHIIYVLDDPRLSADFRVKTRRWRTLYGVDFTAVDGVFNRGYSGANNVGARFGDSDLILFMNSDVIPQAPGWLAGLVDVFRSHGHVGAVAPRLTYADGTIQFAGMEVRWNDQFGIWINHHPLRGCSTSLDPHSEPVDVQVLTGACLLISRSAYTTVDGWDTGYLIGDFEDSDLCLKLRRIGKRRIYVPTIQLTHLERQSMSRIGSDDYRLKVTIFNAVRHQDRWSMPRNLQWRPLERLVG